MMEKRDKAVYSMRKKIIIAALGFFLLVLLLASFFGKKGLLEIFQAQRKQKALLENVERLEKKKSKLEREIEELRENPKAVEKKAREKLWLMKPDEIVIVDKEK